MSYSGSETCLDYQYSDDSDNSVTRSPCTRLLFGDDLVVVDEVDEELLLAPTQTETEIILPEEAAVTVESSDSLVAAATPGPEESVSGDIQQDVEIVEEKPSEKTPVLSRAPEYTDWRVAACVWMKAVC